MKKYIVVWSETHAAEVKARNATEAKEEAMKTSPEKSIVNVYGETITTDKEKEEEN